VEFVALHEIEMEEHFIFRCRVYYMVWRRFHGLYRESWVSPTIYFPYLVQRCLALYL
jgi:hypothetical protein